MNEAVKDPESAAAAATSDAALHYRAMQSRDRRFEGRFIAAITSTGIYCRPGCPAKMPRAENVRFFACAAAAEERGFRACLRCRPDASPLLPAAAGSSATVSRALQLFAQGDHEGGLSALCDKLGVGERHLRRLFLQHLGASPRAVWRTQRLHFARSLLEQTALPMTEVALASGYQSTRRFNAEIQRAFQSSPSKLRIGSLKAALGRGARDQRAERRDRKSEPRDRIELRVPCAMPFDFPALLTFFGARAIDGVEVLEGLRYSRSVRIAGVATPLVLEVAPAKSGDALLVRVNLAPPKALPILIAGVKRMFGCAVQPHVVAEHLARDPLLARALALHPGLRVPGAWDPFELAVRALLGQQISVRAAQTLAGRLVRALGEPLPAELLREGGPTHLFPTPQAIANAGATRLQKLGLMTARAAALATLANAVHSGALDFARLRAKPLDEALAAIEALPGFGPWSANYIALRALSEPDAFPTKDLGLLRGLQRENPAATFRDLQQRAERWRPFRATAAIALWLLLSTPADAPALSALPTEAA